MPKNAANDAAKKRAAKEKKLLVVLALVLVLAAGYAYKTLTKLNSSDEPTGGPVAVSTTSTTTSSPAPPASSPPAQSSTPSGSSASGDSGHLISSITPPLDQGQLRTFTVFDSKDPFFADGPATGAASGTSGSSGSHSAGPTPRSTPPTTAKPSKPASFQAKPRVAAPTSAVISVNGAEGLVSLGSDFPATGDPASLDLFHLVALTQTTAKITVVGGSFASGAATLTLHVGKPVALANVKNGARYVLELFPQGTVPAAPSPGTSTTTTPATLSTPPTS